MEGGGGLRWGEGRLIQTCMQILIQAVIIFDNMTSFCQFTKIWRFCTIEIQLFQFNKPYGDFIFVS